VAIGANRGRLALPLTEALHSGYEQASAIQNNTEHELET